MKAERIFQLTPDREYGDRIVYWMSREQRINDNYSLIYARDLAKDQNKGLEVVFTLSGDFLGANLRQYDFMLKGLQKLALGLKSKNIPFVLLLGNPKTTFSEYLNKIGPTTVIVDFDPLRIKNEWKESSIKASISKFIEVDAHNIIPVRFLTNKLEYGAYTIRPKISRNLDYFLEEIPEVSPMAKSNYSGSVFSLDDVLNSLEIDRTVLPVDWILPGEDEAIKAMNHFIQNKLANYNALRNDPNEQATSELSPYLHFGQLSAQRIVIEVLKGAISDENSKAFLEELIVRRELSDNFCHFNSAYDSVDGFPSWAKKSLDEHQQDEREYIYTLNELEEAKTHDPLWNAAQNQMRMHGKMHGYMRMYWAKKIFEWTKSAVEAMEFSISLNDKYELDGRDPNGYAGIAWSIGGVHDRAWSERHVFGKIRYMNYNGCKRKFDVHAYIRKFQYEN